MADVVVVGGSEETRLLLRGLLRLYHHHIVGEGASFQAIGATMTAVPPNVALVDLDLDNADQTRGLAAALEQFPKLRVLLLTPHRTPQSEARAKSLGIEALVRRPFAVHELMEAIDRAVPTPPAAPAAPTPPPGQQA